MSSTKDMAEGSNVNGCLVVAKIGSSSLTNEAGIINEAAIAQVCAEVRALVNLGARVVLVTSGAIAVGVKALGFESRPTDLLTLQAVSAVGQSRLMKLWDENLASNSLVSGQVLLTPNDFFNRSQYLHARSTLRRLIELNVVPVINENDAITSDEIRFGDNDRIAALVAHLIDADVLVLLTDTAGLFSANPRVDRDAVLIETVEEVTPEILALASGAGSARGSGGMTSKISAAKMASWSGIRSVICQAKPGNLTNAVTMGPTGGTTVLANDRKTSARKLWIGFAGDTLGKIIVDAGAVQALRTKNVSLLSAGVIGTQGEFAQDDIVEICDENQNTFARGLAKMGAEQVRSTQGQSTQSDGGVVVHRDDLVILD